MIELRAGSASCTVSPADGGRVASLSVAGVDVFVRHHASLPASGWGSFPMVPWAGRIRNGRFQFDGVDHQLPINFETHAIHGTGFEQPWEVSQVEARRMGMTCQLQWMLGGQSEQTIELDDQSLTCTLAVRAGERAMPASIGWHPWYIKPERADLEFARMYVRDDDYIADGRVAEPPPPPPWDDCFSGPLSTPRLWIGGLELSIESDCEFWVVYDMRAHATCVEPQSAIPDAFNHEGDLAAPRLEPGEELRRTMTIRWK